MGQLSFFSAEARPARVADLAGLLCGHGELTGFGRGTAARLSVVLAESWRARALIEVFRARGVSVDLSRTERGESLLRTSFRADLTQLATNWLHGAVKSVPNGFNPDGSALRVWTLTAGAPTGGGYLLGLDPDVPETHGPLASSLGRAGLPARVVGSSGAEPALRIVGRRRLTRLAELVGPAPEGAPGGAWPLSP
ncbi:hypothetical protein CDG81_01475 [Actinopolyspora erythraea]|uniref:Homing endonuclease LAGLIDADG domain-containing protein n=1 Tax=Actinopolyspora erythraea TaxID=414996 RepID=A0A099DBH6_9ACTN|nr:hypothetical protein [Actinopolyspora erythraea]ASU77202.1 hypothetical protein CDG81_01475 [Actinopolyspora erythraea]KGI83102.1 hypothetical protein IL38_00200 [Actinopolyspora erythraea]